MCVKHFLSRIGRFFLSLSKLTVLSLWSGGKNGEKTQKLLETI
jgi:hypothetical protein